MSNNEDTIAAIATPSGIGGIGVIRISGPKCLEISRKITGLHVKPRTAHYVRFISSQDQQIDQGIVIYYQSPASYTGEDVLECHTHGNPILMNMLLNEILDLGARPARPGEFTERAFLNNKMDLVQAEAVADLINSSSVKAARSALQSLDGLFSKQIYQTRDDLLEACSLLEASLDFSDEDDVNINMKPVYDAVEKSLDNVRIMIDKAESGRELSKTPKVVLAGPPNVGKSSIVNCLSRADTSIVSSRPGTTRDIIKERVFIDGDQFVLFDTAGIHFSSDEIEKEGIDRTKKSIASADLILYIVDAGPDASVDPSKVLGDLDEDAKILLVKNKIDLYPDAPFTDDECIHVSAKTGKGIEVLEAQIRNTLNLETDDEDVIYARKRHVNALHDTLHSLSRAKKFIDEDHGVEILADEMRRALAGFDQITGRLYVDDILDEIFSSFCIGK